VSKGKHQAKLFSSKKNVGKNKYKSQPSNAPPPRPSKPTGILKSSGPQAPKVHPGNRRLVCPHPEISSPLPPTLEIEEIHTKSRNHRTRTAYKLRLKVKTNLAKQHMPYTHDKAQAAREDVHILVNSKLHPLAVAGLSLGLGYVPSTEPQFSPSPSKVSEAVLDLGRRILTHTDRSGTPPPFYPPAKITAKMTTSKYNSVYTRIFSSNFKLAARHLESIAALHLNTNDAHTSNIPLDVRKQLALLRSDPNVTVTAADKNMGICVVPTTWYTQKCEESSLKARQNGIQDYKVIQEDSAIIGRICTELHTVVTGHSFLKCLKGQFGEHTQSILRYALSGQENRRLASYWPSQDP
jgi:hypothetical protein